MISCWPKSEEFPGLCPQLPPRQSGLQVVSKSASSVGLLDPTRRPLSGPGPHVASPLLWDSPTAFPVPCGACRELASHAGALVWGWKRSCVLGRSPTGRPCVSSGITSEAAGAVHLPAEDADLEACSGGSVKSVSPLERTQPVRAGLRPLRLSPCRRSALRTGHAFRWPGPLCPRTSGRPPPRQHGAPCAPAETAGPRGAQPHLGQPGLPARVSPSPLVKWGRGEHRPQGSDVWKVLRPRRG